MNVRWVYRLLAFAVAIVSVAACRGSQGAGATNTTALADTLKTLIAEAYDFSRSGVVERMHGLYAPTGPVVSASGGSIVASRDSLLAGLTNFWENVGRNMRDPKWQWGNVHVESLGSDAAVLTGSWSIPHIAPTNRPHVISGAWTAVWRRTSSGWRIVHEHLSVPVPRS